MGIVEEDVARVRAATDFVEVASEHLALKRVGRRWVGLCPFHAEKTASFSINAELGLYHCFGCQAKGDVITFVREVEHLDFVEAVERLAAKAGIELRYDEAREGRGRQRRTRLIEAVEAAAEWYHQRLLTAADAAPARAYLRSRGYDGDVVRAFRLGWAPTDWDALARALRLPDDVLRDTGLGIVNRRGRQQDNFRGRVMFPIFDAAGKAVAFGGRALPGADGPKYKNSPETPLYSKSRTLYGLNWAKSEVVSTGEVVVCEGYTDVIGLAAVGVHRAVATCGTALADEHFRMLKNFARRIVLAYDADAAGQAAAERFYDWERRYEIDLFVAALPSGSDPGELARRDPDRLTAAVTEAEPFLRFRVERVLGAADLRSPEGRARAAEAAMAAISEHPSDLVRDQYLMEVADRCRIDAERLRRGVGPHGRAARRPAATATPRRDSGGPELEALRLAVHRRDEVVGRLHPALFADERHGAVFETIARAPTVHDAIAAADPGTADLLQRLAVEEATADVDDVLSQLLRRAVARAVSTLEADARAAPEQALALSAAVGWLKVTVEDLPDPDAADRLVDWLVRWSEEGG
ncbi:MAG TPA: DNA primase [Acidimicrobiales bacterium]|nr:DNA primase [Acidimicrobiales bacterium]